MLWIVLGIIVYLVIGTAAGRHRVSIQTTTNQGITVKLDSMKHSQSCYQNPGGTYYDQNRNCDCKHRDEWGRLLAKVDRPNPYLCVFAWPFLAYHNFLFAAQSAQTKALTMAEHEKQLAQLDFERAEFRRKESEELDRQLESL